MIIKNIATIIVLFGLYLLNANMELRMLDGTEFEPQTMEKICNDPKCGLFGSVTLWKVDNMHLALKTFKSAEISRKEFEIHKQVTLLLEGIDDMRIPRMRYYYVDNGIYGIFMDAVDGKTIAEKERENEINPGNIFEVFIQMSDIIVKLYKKNIYPLDFNAGNVMIDKDNNVWLIDLGHWTVLEKQEKLDTETVEICLKLVVKQISSSIGSPDGKLLEKHLIQNEGNIILSKLCETNNDCDPKSILDAKKALASQTDYNDNSHGSTLYYGIFIKIFVFALLFVI